MSGEPREELKGNDPRRPDAFMVAWYGTYTVNEADKTVTWKPEGGGYSPRFGTPSSIKITNVTADKLSYIGSPRKDQIGTFIPHAELTRAK